MSRVRTLIARARDDRSAFTLVELMVVILIIAILIGAAIPTFLGLRHRAQDSAAKQDLRNTLTAVKALAVEYEGSYDALSEGAALVDGLEDIEPAIEFAALGAIDDIDDSKVHVGVTDGSFVAVRRSESTAIFCVVDGPGGSVLGQVDEDSGVLSPDDCQGSDDGSGNGDDHPGDDDGGEYEDDAELTLISAGSLHTCGIADGGAVYCWGRNLNGRLGIGDNPDRPYTPQPVVGDLTFKSISVGGLQACGIADGGTTYCWGYNAYGEVGIDSQKMPITTPQEVAGGLTFKSISAGYQHTCGITTNGAAYCWGWGNHGRLGNEGDEQTHVRAPMEVSGSLTFKSISPGYQHTCGITTNGAAYCWGNNDKGQLGKGDTGGTYSTPQEVAGGLTFKSISAGNQHTCGITDAGATYCWGANDEGQIGKGDTGGTYSTPQEVAGGLTFKSISAGYQHTCGITDAGATYCWGANDEGQIGTGVKGGAYNTPHQVGA